MIAEVKEFGGVDLDGIAQQILVALADADHLMTVTDLVGALNIDRDRQQGRVSKKQVRDRLERLQDAGLVSREGLLEMPGGIEDAYQYGLTEEGDWYLHGEEMIDVIQHPPGPESEIKQIRIDVEPPDQLSNLQEKTAWMQEHLEVQERHAIALQLLAKKLNFNPKELLDEAQDVQEEQR